MMKIDLHCHTTMSDGSYSFAEALALAKENKVTQLAFTNHDTVKGLSEAIDLGWSYDVDVIPGIEISAYDFLRQRKVHLLGYCFDLDAVHLSNLCEPMRKRRHQLSLKQCEIMRELGYSLDEQSLTSKVRDGGTLYKQHLMQVLIEDGVTDSIYGSFYRSMFKGDGPCALEIEYVDVFDALAAIIADGGIPVLAHPGQLDSYDLVESLVKAGLKGIEKYHCTHTAEDEKKVQELADRYDLFVTGGSDFHGIYGNELTIGSFTTPEASFDEIVRLKHHQC